MTAFAHDCAQLVWPQWGPCSTCGLDRVCCTDCGRDLTPHETGCPALT